MNDLHSSSLRRVFMMTVSSVTGGALPKTPHAHPLCPARSIHYCPYCVEYRQSSGKVVKNSTNRAETYHCSAAPLLSLPTSYFPVTLILGFIHTWQKFPLSQMKSA